MMRVGFQSQLDREVHNMVRLRGMGKMILAIGLSTVIPFLSNVAIRQHRIYFGKLHRGYIRF